MSLTRSCDLCAGGDDVQRYTLTRKVSGEGGQRSRSMGGLDLCLPCWKREAEHRMRGRNRVIGRGLKECCVCDAPGIAFSLKVSRRDGKRVIDRAAGGVTLCESCWSRTSKSNIRKDRELVLARRIFRGES
jgi:hypothetical protein